jgi:hypothetical protein
LRGLRINPLPISSFTLAVADDRDMDNRGNDPITPAEVAKSKDEGLFDDEKGIMGTETVGPGFQWMGRPLR